MHSSPLRRSWLSWGGALAVFVCALPVWADAPADQYEPFDGSESTITDRYTLLEWDRHQNPPYPPAAKFVDAATNCKKAGKRLPTLKELLTIVDEAPYSAYVEDHNEDRYIDRNAFVNTPKQAFWTSTRVIGAADSAYTVDFSTGFVNQASIADGDSRSVRCVK